MNNIVGRLQNIISNRQYDDDAANYIDDVLFHTPMWSLSIPARCMMLGILQHCIHRRERSINLAYDEGDVIADLSINHQQDYDNILLLQSVTTFSADLGEDLEQKRHHLVDAINRSEKMTLGLCHWFLLTRADRYDILDRLRVMNERTHDLPSLRMVAFIPHPRATRLGSGDRSLSQTFNQPDISLSTKLLGKRHPALPVEVTHHEATHIYIRELARSFGTYKIPSEHPLFNDGQLAHARARYDAYYPETMPQVYNTDPEEIVAKTEGQRFIIELGFQPQAMRVS